MDLPGRSVSKKVSDHTYLDGGLVMCYGVGFRRICRVNPCLSVW